MISYWQAGGGGQFLLKLGNAGMHMEAHRSGLSREESSEEPQSGQGEDVCRGQNCGWNSSQEICQCSLQSLFATCFGSQHRKKDGPFSLMPFLQAAAVLEQWLTCLHLRAGPPGRTIIHKVVRFTPSSLIHHGRGFSIVCPYQWSCGNMT